VQVDYQLKLIYAGSMAVVRSVVPDPGALPTLFLGRSRKLMTGVAWRKQSRGKKHNLSVFGRGKIFLSIYQNF